VGGWDGRTTILSSCHRRCHETFTNWLWFFTSTVSDAASSPTSLAGALTHLISMSVSAMFPTLSCFAKSEVPLLCICLDPRTRTLISRPRTLISRSSHRRIILGCGTAVVYHKACKKHEMLLTSNRSRMCSSALKPSCSFKPIRNDHENQCLNYICRVVFFLLPHLRCTFVPVQKTTVY
jgi:hypothetical protein